MSSYAVINNAGLVVDITEWDGIGEWSPLDGFMAVAIDDSGAGIGWAYEAGVFTEPPLIPSSATLDQAKVIMSSALAWKRQQVENAGVTVGGIAIGSDQTARTLLNDAITAFNNGLTGSLDYKFANGTWIPVDLPTAQAMFTAIGQQVQACTANQQALATAINAATDLAGLQAIDITQGWPA